MGILKVEVIDGFSKVVDGVLVRSEVISGEPAVSDVIRITYDNGDIREKVYQGVYVPPEPERVYAHIHISGGHAGSPLWINGNGTDDIQISIAIREGLDPGSAIKDYSVPWSLVLRDSDNNVFDFLGFQLTSGEKTIDYTSTKPGKISIQSTDVNDTISNNVITLVTAPQFNVYRIV
jgi:hypothetical protein